MNGIHNKDGPDFDVGVPTMKWPRDGTERKPRDGTERRPRDGTERKPRDRTERRSRDGTGRKPRDETMSRNGSLESGYYYQLTRKPQDVRIHGNPPSKWRKTRWNRPALMTGMQEVCPVENENRI